MVAIFFNLINPLFLCFYLLLQYDSSLTLPMSFCMYIIVKQMHVILVIISVALFQVRYWRIKFLQQETNKLSKVMPHVVDTLLLIAGVSLAWLGGFSPFNSHWLLVKIIAVVAYILLGFIAMRNVGLKQWLAYLLATIIVLYIMSVAHLKTVWPLP